MGSGPMMSSLSQNGIFAARFYSAHFFFLQSINNKKYYKIHGRMAIVYNAKQVLGEILISCVLIVRSQIYQTHSSLGLKCRCMKDCQGSILEFGPCKLLL